MTRQQLAVELRRGSALRGFSIPDSVPDHLLIESAVESVVGEIGLCLDINATDIASIIDASNSVDDFSRRCKDFVRSSLSRLPDLPVAPFQGMKLLVAVDGSKQLVITEQMFEAVYGQAVAEFSAEFPGEPCPFSKAKFRRDFVKSLRSKLKGIGIRAI